MINKTMVRRHRTATRSRPAAVLVGASLVVALGLVLAAALSLGTPRIGVLDLWAVLGDADDPRHLVLTEVRLPRVVLAVLAGAALGLSGLLLQDALRNPIAGPELLGVSSGAAVVMTAVVVLALPVPLALQPYAALVGAVVAGSLVLSAIGRTRDVTRMVLVGAAVSAACAGLVVSLVGLGTQGNVVLLFRYLLGSLNGRTWEHVEVVLPWIVLGTLAAALLRSRVAALALGDDVAVGLGVPVAVTRVLALGVAALLAAATASVCGPIAYVALLAPHLARRLVGSTSTRRVFWVVPVLGAGVLVLADLVSRLLLYPVEVPVGVATTLVGVPVLLLALHREQGDR